MYVYVFILPSIKIYINVNIYTCAIWYHLYNLKKHEKHPWRSATFNKVAGFQPATLLKNTHGVKNINNKKVALQKKINE